MPRRPIRTCVLLVCCFVTLAVGTAQAGLAPGAIELVPGVESSGRRVEPAAVNATCSLGELGTINNTFGAGAVTSDGVTYYTLLDPGDCLTCRGLALLLTKAHVLGRYIVPGGCTFTVEVSIVAATPGSPCSQPDPGIVLCGPQTFDYFATSVSFQPFIASFPLPSGCCVNGPAFLSVKLVSRGDCDPSEFTIGFESPPVCSDCRSFVAFPLSPPSELCAGGWGSTFRQWVDADCCEPVPTDPGTWGKVKALYR